MPVQKGVPRKLVKCEKVFIEILCKKGLLTCYCFTYMPFIELISALNVLL